VQQIKDLLDKKLPEEIYNQEYTERNTDLGYPGEKCFESTRIPYVRQSRKIQSLLQLRSPFLFCRIHLKTKTAAARTVLIWLIAPGQPDKYMNLPLIISESRKPLQYSSQDYDCHHYQGPSLPKITLRDQKVFFTIWRSLY